MGLREEAIKSLSVVNDIENTPPSKGFDLKEIVETSQRYRLYRYLHPIQKPKKIKPKSNWQKRIKNLQNSIK
jgi:hypothetical protein